VTSTTTSADRILRIGGWITALGLLFTVIAVLPLVIPSLDLPSTLWWLSMLTGVGLVIVFIGLVLGARQRRSRR
jgi:hypothetical protein